jgi:pimeloyl-ACP methyl ester carboxylesterase/phenylacetate-coenzyme A ligase PaaK-like adenylate-forming protein
MSESRRQLARDARLAVREGPEGIARRQHSRLADLVAYARANSPYYRELYRKLPEQVDGPTLLPVTDKSKLMARFDDWVTDREVTREKVETFVADPGLVGHRFLDRYLVATTSGTSGVRGLFLLDERSMSMETALGSRAASMLGAGDVIRVLARGGRTAIVTSPGGHFYTVAATARFQLDHPRLGRRMRVFSIRQPLPELVDELNQFNSAILSGFLGMLTVLAGEQEAGRLRIHPALVIPGGETLTADLRRRLAAAFGARVRAAYAATECSFLAIGCPHGWYHVNSDWAVLEPVDADHRPTPPGELSHTALLSNLANQVQPVLRYDLGDSILLRPDPCPCGNMFPAVQVQGRAADLLTFSTAHGEPVTMSPILFGTLLDRLPSIGQFQLVQTAPSTLRVRLRTAACADGAPDQVWQTVRAEITHLLAEHKLADVTLERADEPPQQEPGGKFRRVIPLIKPTPEGQIAAQGAVSSRIAAGSLMNAFIPPRASTEYLDLDGGRVRLLRGGEPTQRPPVILLHGAGTNAAISWYRTFAPLSAEHQVIAPDMPGCGGTTGIEPLGGGAVLADFLARVMDELGVADAVIVGSSMGGEVALNLALHHPKLVRALVLVSPSGLLPIAGNRVRQYIAWLATRLPERMLVSLNRLSKRSARGLRGIVHDPAVLPAELIEEYRRDALRPGSGLAFVRQTRASVGRREMRNNLLPLVGRITVPTLVVHGANDPVVSPETSRQAVERMPIARRVVIPNCGHWAQLEAPDRFLTELSHFLATAA